MSSFLNILTICSYRRGLKAKERAAYCQNQAVRTADENDNEQSESPGESEDDLNDYWDIIEEHYTQWIKTEKNFPFTTKVKNAVTASERFFSYLLEKERENTSLEALLIILKKTPEGKKKQLAMYVELGKALVHKKSKSGQGL